MELRQLSKPDGGQPERWTAFGESRIGGRRENQDSYDARETRFGFVVTVCDGMGGGPGGKTASSIAVREIVMGVEAATDDEERINIVKKAVLRANMAILETANQHPELRGMGSTATVLLLSDRSAIVAHVGDSRVYQLRGRRTKVFRTFDHSMVFDLVRQQVITEEQARLSAQSNVITRALGLRPDLEVDAVELPFEKGDRFALCSDGIHGTMPEEDLIARILSKKAVGVVTDDIATYVDNLGHETGGGHDNLTLAIVETKINSSLKPKMTKQAKLILLCLAVVCVLSMVINIIQATTIPEQATEEATMTIPAIDPAAIQSIAHNVQTLAIECDSTKRDSLANQVVIPTLKALNQPSAEQTK